MLIDCDTCRVRGTDCADCVITLLLGTPGNVSAPAEFTEPETAAFAALADGGLVPPLRLVPVLSDHLCPGAGSNGPAARAG